MEIPIEKDHLHDGLLLKIGWIFQFADRSHYQKVP